MKIKLDIVPSRFPRPEEIAVMGADFASNGGYISIVFGEKDW